MNNVNVYICPKYKYIELLRDGTVPPGAVLYPEIEVAHFDWFDFYNNNQFKFTTVVTQSSEFIRFLRTNNIMCTLYMMFEDSDKMVELQFDDASRTLLSCYERLFIKECLFDE